jgi:hypothetical protein
MVGLLSILFIASACASHIIITFVDRNDDHLVMLNACFKYAFKSEYLALFGDANKIKARLSQAELSKYF